MLVGNMINICIRVVTDRALVWMFPWTTVLFVWCTFIGMYVVYRRGTDITVDFFYDRIGAGGKKAMRVFAHLVVIAVLVMMLAATVGGYVMARVGRRLPSSFVRAVVIITGAVMTVLFFRA